MQSRKAITNQARCRNKDQHDTDRCDVFDDYGCNHISIKIGHLDVNVIEDNTFDVEYINLTSKDLHWLYNKGLKNSDWNTTYNTDNNQIISKFINVLFQTV